MLWAFVDFENVGTLENLELGKYQKVIIFCGPRHKKINFGDIPTDSFTQLELLRMASTGNNNLDFHLAMYLGVHHMQAAKVTEFHVISKDKGFDGIVAHLNSIGRQCKRVSINEATKSTAKKATAKKATAKKVTAKKATAKKATAKKVTAKKATAKKATAKKATAKKATAKKATAKKATAKKATAKKATAKKATVKKETAKKATDEIPTDYELGFLKAAGQLQKCKADSRPSSRGKLINWLKNKLNNDQIDPARVYADLVDRSYISLVDNKLQYGVLLQEPQKTN